MDGLVQNCPGRDQRLVSAQPPSAVGGPAGRLSARLAGHYACYGITGNIAQLGRRFRQAAKSWRKRLARRTRPHVLSWDSFNAILERRPLPHPRIVHHYAARNQALR